MCKNIKMHNDLWLPKNINLSSQLNIFNLKEKFKMFNRRLNLPKLNPHSSPEDVNQVLKILNAVSNIKVCEKEITFTSSYDRQRYCSLFDVENPSSFGLSYEMFKELNGHRIDGTLFLCANREPRGNIYTVDWNNSSRKERQEIIRKNAEQTLDWHVTVIFYRQRILYYYVPLMKNENPMPVVSTDFAFRSKLYDFLAGREAHGIPIDQMFVSATVHSPHKTCRCLCIEFIEEVVSSASRNEKCTKFVFKEFVLGPSHHNKGYLKRWNQFKF